MMDISVVPVTIALSLLPGQNCPVWIDRSETEPECTSEISFSSIKGRFLDPADRLQFGNISGNLPFGDIQKR